MGAVNGMGFAETAIKALREREQRKAARHPIRLRGRIRMADGREEDCVTLDASIGGLGIAGPVPGAVGERVTCIFEELGWIDGEVVRLATGGFGMAFVGSPDRLARNAARVEWLAAREAEGLPDNRRGARIVPLRTDVAIHVADVELPATVIDLSPSGVAVASRLRPPQGSEVTVGRRRATVTRHLENGFAAEFRLPIGMARFDENVVL